MDKTTPKTVRIPLIEGLVDAAMLAEEELAAQTIRDPFGRSPTASSVAPAPPSPKPTPRAATSAAPARATGIDAGAWDLFRPALDQTLASAGTSPRQPISAQEIASIEIYARITAAIERHGATAETLARFGLDAATWAETERTFAERLASSPQLARAFATMLARVRG